jgi:hypothetical protein
MLVYMLVWTKLQHILSMAGQQIPQVSENSGRQCNHNTEYSRFSRYFAQRCPTSMTVHMETVYAADKNVTVSTFPGFRMTVRSSDASNVYITGLDEATEYTFYGWAKNSAGISETRRTPVQPPYRISDSPDISLNVSLLP